MVTIMIGHLGFSYMGLIFLFLLIMPNLIWTKNKPHGYGYHNENKVLLTFERVGQVLVSCIVLIFKDFNLQKWSIWSWWLIGAIILIIMYELWWLRYFKSARNLVDFYSSFLGIPVAGATLPVAAFFMLGIYGKVIWLVIAVVILGIGHIGLHLEHRKETSECSI